MAGALALALASGLSTGCSPPTLTVSITFDDGYAEVDQAARILESKGLRGTFFIISGSINHRSYLTLAQVRALEAAGHEVGGHTVSHLHLPVIPVDEAQRQICNDRATLLAYGLHPQSFAYPFGEYDPAVEQFVAGCGYDVGRIVGPIPEPTAPTAEEIPPRDPYAAITPYSVLNTTTLDQIEGWVTAAQGSQGWLPLVFHHLCQPGVPCEQYGITVEDFTALLDWLKALPRVAIRPVREVTGGSLKPLPVLVNPVINPSMEDATDGGIPAGWQRGGSGVNTALWTTTEGLAHTGTSAQRVDVSSYTSGSVQLVPSLQTYGLAGTPSHRYQVSGWYLGNGQLRWVAYYRDGAGGWHWWSQGPLLPETEAWAPSTWTTPPLPDKATGLSFGFSLSSVGSLTVDDFAMRDLTLSAAQAR